MFCIKWMHGAYVSSMCTVIGCLYLKHGTKGKCVLNPHLVLFGEWNTHKSVLRRASIVHGCQGIYGECKTSVCILCICCEATHSQFVEPLWMWCVDQVCTFHLMTCDADCEAQAVRPSAGHTVKKIKLPLKELMLHFCEWRKQAHMKLSLKVRLTLNCTNSYETNFQELSDVMQSQQKQTWWNTHRSG